MTTLIYLTGNLPAAAPATPKRRGHGRRHNRSQGRRIHAHQLHHRHYLILGECRLLASSVAVHATTAATHATTAATHGDTAAADTTHGGSHVGDDHSEGLRPNHILGHRHGSGPSGEVGTDAGGLVLAAGALEGEARVGLGAPLPGARVAKPAHVVAGQFLKLGVRKPACLAAGARVQRRCHSAVDI